MLLSLLASFHWVGKEHYALKIGAFIILVSLLPTLLPVSLLVLLIPSFPASFLSFPFYSWYDELPAPLWLSPEIQDLHPWLYYHGIRFLNMNVTFSPDWEVRGDSIVTHNLWDNFSNAFVIAFSFFVLVNIVGALIGYGMGKKIRTKFFDNDWRFSLYGIVAVFCLGFSLLLPSGLLLFGLGIVLLWTMFLPLIEKALEISLGTLVYFLGF